MVVFPNAKINIGLNIVERRGDGYHNIESCFYPVPWYDALEAIESDKFSFTSTGIAIPGKDNICIKAYELLKSDFPLSPVCIHLHKNIPVGAGLGGGSADGVFMLKLLNEKFSLGLGLKQLHDYARKLGSDCPFFIENELCYVEGRGDIFLPIDINLSGLYLVIIFPQVHVDTSSAYNSIKPAQTGGRLKDLLEGNEVSKWPKYIINDFEKNASQVSLDLKDMLYKEGALYASMSGSGSAVYGIFSEQPKIKANYPLHIAQL